MGRKNKTKLLKHGSQSLNASTIAESEGRLSSNDNHQLDLEAQLREFVSSGSTPERHRNMRILFSTLEKRDAELVVAKQLIQKLKSGAPSEHNGDGDSSLAANEDTFSESLQGLNGYTIIDELDHFRKQNGDLISKHEKFAQELSSSEEHVAQLKDEVNALEKKLEDTNIALDQGSQTSKVIIDELTQSLNNSNDKIDTLTAEILSQKASYRNTCAELELEKSRRMKQEEHMTRSIRIEEELRRKLNLATEQSSTRLQQLLIDNEKLESRYESINNGVQLIKRDFDEVKKNLVKSKEHVHELQHQLTASKADVKHYKDNEDACRKYIKKLEETIQLAKVSSAEELSDLQEKYDSAQNELQKAADEMVLKANAERKLIEELQHTFQSEHIANVFEAVQKLQENFKREQHKLVFQSAALEGKDVALQKLIQQNNKLLESINNSDSQNEQEKKLIKEEMRKYNEELDQAKQRNKKLNKEKNQSLKRLKTLLAEKFNLLEQNKTLEDKLNQSMCSRSNESMASENSDALDLLEMSVKSLKSTLESTENTLSQVSQQLLNKEEENLDLHRTVAAYKSKLVNYEHDQVENQKIVSMLESRLVELQKSTDVQQKRYEEDLSEVRQRLESLDDALQIQQELNAKVKSQAEDSQKNYSSEKHSLEEMIQQLESTVVSLESDKVRINALITSTEKDKCKISEEKQLIEATMRDLDKMLIEKDQLIEKEKLASEESLRQAKKERNMLKEGSDRIISELAEFKLSQAEKASVLVEMNQQLEVEVETLRTQIMKQDVEIEILSTNAIVSNQATEDLTRLVTQKEEEHEKALQSERAKFEILKKKLEEKTTESSEKVRLLKEKENRMEESRTESEKTSQEMRETIQRKENELAQIVSEKAELNSEINALKASVAEKQSEIDTLLEDKSTFVSQKQHLENEVEHINKKLEDATSPKKDKVIQLENRLEVLQTASKAQHKRLEEELSSARALLAISSEKAVNLEQQIAELQQQILVMDEIQSRNVLLNEEVKNAAQLKVVVSDLEQQKKDIQLETAEERAGLVNELIDAKQKLAERNQQLDELQNQCKLINSQNVEAEEIEPRTGSESEHAIDSMFPTMDPAVRQLVILLSENRNYSYGVLGLVVYGFLVHLYILWY